METSASGQPGMRQTGDGGDKYLRQPTLSPGARGPGPGSLCWWPHSRHPLPAYSPQLHSHIWIPQSPGDGPTRACASPPTPPLPVPAPRIPIPNAPSPLWTLCSPLPQGPPPREAHTVCVRTPGPWRPRGSCWERLEGMCVLELVGYGVPHKPGPRG